MSLLLQLLVHCWLFLRLLLSLVLKMSGALYLTTLITTGRFDTLPASSMRADFSPAAISVLMFTCCRCPVTPIAGRPSGRGPNVGGTGLGSELSTFPVVYFLSCICPLRIERRRKLTRDKSSRCSILFRRVARGPTQFSFTWYICPISMT